MANTVIITGASQGIGRATALEFARQGYDVILAARQPDRLEAVAAEVRAIGRVALAVPTDVQDADSARQLVQQALNQFERIDVLINNAGIFALGAVETFTLEDWERVIRTNLWGYIHMIHALLPHLLEQGRGTIVNVSSIGGLDAIPYQIPYTTSKFAVTGMTKALHAELKPKGILVCGVYPSFIRTQLLERALFRGENQTAAQQRHDLVAKALQTPFLETPEIVAKAIWDGVKHQRSDVTVGTAKLWTTLYHLFPGLMKPLYRRVFGSQDRPS